MVAFSFISFVYLATAVAFGVPCEEGVIRVILLVILKQRTPCRRARHLTVILCVKYYEEEF